MLQVSNVSHRGGFRGFGDAKSDAITLQLAANRYAKEVGKTPLNTDGAIGPLTLAMVQAALKFLVSKNVSADTATGLLAKLTTTAQLTTSAVVVSGFLNDSMDTIRLAATQTLEPTPATPSKITTGYAQLISNYPVQFIQSNPSVQTAPPKPSQTSQQTQTLQPAQSAWPTTTTAVVGLSPKAKKSMLIVGGALVGLLVLKKLL